MERRFITPTLIFMMKYFFDIEKEITQQLLFSLQTRLLDCKEIAAHLYQVAISHR